MAKKSLVKGAAVLAVAGIVVKVLGAFFRIPLGNMIGAEGMANYSPAYSLYAFMLVFATAGLPVAISKMVSERCATGQFREAERVFKISRTLMMIIGVIGFCLLFFFSDTIAESDSSGTAACPDNVFIQRLFSGNAGNGSYSSFSGGGADFQSVSGSGRCMDTVQQCY